MSHRLALHPGSPVRTEVRRLAATLLEEAAGELRGIDDDLSGAVERLSERLRELRSLIRLVRFEIGEKAYRLEEKRLRDLCRSLEPIRQSSAMIAAAEHLTEGPGRLNQLQAGALVSRLQNRHLEIAFGLAQSSTRDEIDRQLAEAGRSLPLLPIRGEGYPVFRKGFETVAELGFERMLSARSKKTTEHLRAWGRQAGHLGRALAFLSAPWSNVIVPLAEESLRLNQLLQQSDDRSQLVKILATDRTLAHRSLRRAIREDLQQRNRTILPTIFRLGQMIHAEPPQHLAARVGDYWMRA